MTHFLIELLSWWHEVLNVIDLGHGDWNQMPGTSQPANGIATQEVHILFWATLVLPFVCHKMHPLQSMSILADYSLASGTIRC